jgi:hypothetical protein
MFYVNKYLHKMKKTLTTPLGFKWYYHVNKDNKKEGNYKSYYPLPGGCGL